MQDLQDATTAAHDNPDQQDTAEPATRGLDHWMVFMKHEHGQGSGSTQESSRSGAGRQEDKGLVRVIIQRHQVQALGAVRVDLQRKP